MKLGKIGFLLFLTFFLVNTCFSQPIIQVNKNVKLTVKVITIKSKHFIIPNLKVFSDTQDIQVYRQISYANDRNPVADCCFFLAKVIKDKLVNMYVNRSYDLDVDRDLRKFTTKDLLTDTICIEDFIPLEPGQYAVSLVFGYYRNGVKDVINSDDFMFFVAPQKPIDSGRIKKGNVSSPK